MRERERESLKNNRKHKRTNRMVMEINFNNASEFKRSILILINC